MERKKIVLYLYSAFLVLMTTQSSLQYSFTFTQSHTHSYSASMSNTLLFYEGQFEVQHLAQGHLGMQMGKTGDPTADLQVGGRPLYPSATAHSLIRSWDSDLFLESLALNHGSTSTCDLWTIRSLKEPYEYKSQRKPMKFLNVVCSISFEVKLEFFQLSRYPTTCEWYMNKQRPCLFIYHSHPHQTFHVACLYSLTYNLLFWYLNFCSAFMTQTSFCLKQHWLNLSSLMTSSPSGQTFCLLAPTNSEQRERENRPWHCFHVMTPLTGRHQIFIHLLHLSACAPVNTFPIELCLHKNISDT